MAHADMPTGHKTLCTDKRCVERLAEEFGTPFYLYDEAGIRRSAKALHDAFAWNEGFREFYAVKACPNPAVIDILREYGCGLDCATMTELILAHRMGVNGAEVMFSSNVTPAADFRMAHNLGATLNFDDLGHLGFYEREVGRLPSPVSLRYNPGEEWDGGENAIFGSPTGSKFGMTYEQLVAACQHLRESGHTQFGIHALVASNALDENYYPRLAELLFGVALRVSERTGLSPAFVNLSGGIGIPYRPDERAVDIAAVGEGVRLAYERTLGAVGLGSVALYTELGRYLTGPHGYLVTRVLHRKRCFHDYLGVDASTADLLRPAMYGAYHHVSVLGQPGGPDKTDWAPTTRYDVVGGLCENNDRLADERLLPQVDVGDLLVIHDAGAHSRSMGHNYNGRLRAGEVLLHPDGSARLIRRAETPDDYFATLDVLGGSFPARSCASSGQPRGKEVIWT